MSRYQKGKDQEGKNKLDLMSGSGICWAIITEDVAKGIDILMQYRSMCDIAADNPFLFANNTSRTGEPLRGHDCIRRVSLSASLQHTETAKVPSTGLLGTWGHWLFSRNI